jgi:hypothetical protein
VKLLLQAALQAHATICFAMDRANPEDIATVPDWRTVRAQLRRALAAAGHPAGGRD